MPKYSKSDREEAIARLHKWLKPGDTVHTILRHVSRSGMSREIGVVIIGKDGDTIHPNWAVARLAAATRSSIAGCDPRPTQALSAPLHCRAHAYGGLKPT